MPDEPMRWDKLLSAKRVRELYGGRATNKDGSDIRSEFQRDFDRSLFSTPVRRLQDKAQVFPLEPHDSVRTRLTHSLEVSNVARGLARAVTTDLANRQLLTGTQADDIELVAATCGLIHDLGNPPFGHAGEEAMRTWLVARLDRDEKLAAGLASPVAASARRMRDDFRKFEGNAQTLRIVARLQVLTDYYGLNLTCGTMSAACKYTATADQAGTPGGPHHRKKPGYFTSEDDLIDKVRAEVGTGDRRNPITYLVEAADDIVYGTVDIEDGVKKGSVTWAEARERLRHHAGGANATLDAVLGRTDGKVAEAGRPDQFPFASERERGETAAQTFRTFAITEAALAVRTAFVEWYDDIMRGRFGGELLEGSSAGPLVRACKETARECIFRRDADVLSREIAGREVIHGLMDIFWEGVGGYDPTAAPHHDFPSKIRSLISDNYLRVFRHSWGKGLPADYLRLLLVTDYVCGMTDSFATNLYKKLRNG